MDEDDYKKKLRELMKKESVLHRDFSKLREMYYSEKSKVKRRRMEIYLDVNLSRLNRLNSAIENIKNYLNDVYRTRMRR